MAITREKKAELVSSLQAEFSATESVILVDYKGLDVPQVTEPVSYTHLTLPTILLV